MLSTPYYRTLAQTHSLGCDDEPDVMYGPYDIFCMGTRLYPTVYKLFGRNVELIFKGVHENNRMEIKIELIKIVDTGPEPLPNEQIKITKDQYKILNNAVNIIVTEHVDYCLIDKNELYLSLPNRNYSRSWFYTMIGYVPVSTGYNPFVKHEGIYLSFNRNSDYKTAYNEVVKIILDTMNKYYKEGVIYKAGNIAEKWKLERLDHEEVMGRLHRPMWSDKRFAPYPVDFLLERIKGDPYIRIKVSDNLVNRHYIAKKLYKYDIEGFIFDGSYIKILVDDIDTAQYIAALVESVEYVDSTEKVVIYSTNSLNKINLEATKNLLEKPNCIQYQVSSVERPYIFSCIVDINTPNTVIDLLRKKIFLQLDNKN